MEYSPASDTDTEQKQQDQDTQALQDPEVADAVKVLPGTGGLTRLVDKRRVRRDRADYFCTLEEGIKGKRAVEWGLVDEVVFPKKNKIKATESPEKKM